MVKEWNADKIIKKIAEAASESIGKAAEAGQSSMKSATSDKFHDTGTLNRSFTISESNSFPDIPATESSPEMGRSGVRAFIKEEGASLWVGSGQAYAKYLFKHGFQSVMSGAFGAVKRAFKLNIKL